MSPDLVRAFAPTGTLRAAINLGSAAEGIYFVKFITGAVPVIRVAVSR